MALDDRLTVKIEPDRLTFSYGGATIGGPDPREVEPEWRAQAVLEEFKLHGVDASAVGADILQAIRDYRSERP